MTDLYVTKMLSAENVIPDTIQMNGCTNEGCAWCFCSSVIDR